MIRSVSHEDFDGQIDLYMGIKQSELINDLKTVEISIAIIPLQRVDI